MLSRKVQIVVLANRAHLVKLTIFLREGDLLSQGGASGSDRADLCFRSLHYVGRERRVLQISGVSFAVVNSPPKEINQRLALARIFLILVNENVGVARNRIYVRTGSIRYRHAQIFRRV